MGFPTKRDAIPSSPPHPTPLLPAAALPVPQETFAAYRASGGYGTEGKLVAALEKWGPNKFEVPVPRFTELLWEQLLAPFFCFQVFCVGLWALDEYWCAAAAATACYSMLLRVQPGCACVHRDGACAGSCCGRRPCAVVRLLGLDPPHLWAAWQARRAVLAFSSLEPCVSRLGHWARHAFLHATCRHCRPRGLPQVPSQLRRRSAATRPL